MAVAASVFAPLTANFGAGASAMASLNVAVSVSVVPCLTASAGGSLNVAVIVNALPDFTAPAGAYVRAAVGAVVSIRTALVSGAVKLRLALLPNASLIVPPFKLIADATAMPSASVSPLTVV